MGEHWTATRPARAGRRIRVRAPAWAILAWAAAWTLAAPMAQAQPKPPTAVTEEAVNQAIAKGVGFLYRSANPDGIWDPMPPPDLLKMKIGGNRDWGGRSALALNALAVAGQQGDARFRKGLTEIMKHPLVGTYTLSLRLQLLHNLSNSAPYRKVLDRDGRRLLSGARPYRGLVWTYLPPPERYDYGGGVPGDFSCTNYAVLGLWAASDERFEVPAQAWLGLEQAYCASQQDNGGWSYLPGKENGAAHGGTTGSMTTAAIASLYLILDQIYARREGITMRTTNAYKSIQTGLDWMGKNFSASGNPGRPDWFRTYYFYNCERVAAAAGLKYFGTHDWFREIAAVLLASQGPDGSFALGTADQYGGKAVDTSYALLFLAKGSAPVIVNKLQHEGDWDNHIRELAALTGWLAKQSERQTNWQVVNLKAPAEDLTDSRLLYIAGAKPLKFSDADKARLKRYVELGGMLVFHPDNNSKPFEDSAATLLSELWPALELSTVDLAQHPLGSIYASLKSARISVRQLASPTRVLAMVVRNDPAVAWERRLYATSEDMFQLAAALHYFANDKCPMRDMPTKLTYFAEPFRQAPPAGGRTVALARLQYAPSVHQWDPEPLAFERLARLMARREKVTLDVKLVKPAELASCGARLAHITGCGEFEPTPELQAAIKAFLAGGGTLIADQAGGPRKDDKGNFDASFRKLAASMYGEDAFRGMSTSVGPLAGLDKLVYRHVMGDRVSLQPARLECVRLGPGGKPDPDGRIAIVYSRYDLTCALLGNPNPMASGAGDEAAYTIMTRLLLAPPPTTATASATAPAQAPTQK